MGSVPADVYAALADPTRRRILDLVRDRERSVTELVAACDLPQPSVSKQLRVLSDAGLVTVRPDGPRRIYALRPAPLMELDAWLARYRRRWASHLDALERALDEGSEGGEERKEGKRRQRPR